MQSTRARGGGWPLHPIRGSDIVVQSVTSGSTYTVPAGKILVLLSAYIASSATAGLMADSVCLIANGSTGVLRVVTNQHKQTAEGTNFADRDTVLGDNWHGNTAITDTPLLSGGSTSTKTVLTDGPWLFTLAPGTVLASNSADACVIWGYLIPANAA